MDVSRLWYQTKPIPELYDRRDTNRPQKHIWHLFLDRCVMDLRLNETHWHWCMMMMMMMAQWWCCCNCTNPRKQWRWRRRQFPDDQTDRTPWCTYRHQRGSSTDRSHRVDTSWTHHRTRKSHYYSHIQHALIETTRSPTIALKCNMQYIVSSWENYKFTKIMFNIL